MNILVIGESCTDKFIYGEVNRLSPEAPVPVFSPIETTQNPGMAGNVVANLKALEVNSKLIHLTQEESIYKTRYVDIKTNHMFIRVDEGENNVTPFKWTPLMDIHLGQADIVVVSDYNKGYLNNSHLQTIAKKSKLSILDSKRKLTDNIIKDFTFIKLNESEHKNNLDLSHPGLIITLGSRGAWYKGKVIPQSNPQQTIDVSGAGDTFTAAFILNYYKHKDINKAIMQANIASGKVVTKRGVVTP
jgi:D-beta-D-heptose 7-phosphate kinase/D-beta-D-heptose 1-phosphate adenosyltransferase